VCIHIRVFDTYLEEGKLGLSTKRRIPLGVTQSWQKNRFEHSFVIVH
jgi:hypothetical protein